MHLKSSFVKSNFFVQIRINHLYLLIRLQLRTRNKSQNPHNIQGVEMTTSWSVEVKINAVSLVLIWNLNIELYLFTFCIVVHWIQRRNSEFGFKKNYEFLNKSIILNSCCFVKTIWLKGKIVKMKFRIRFRIHWTG